MSIEEKKYNINMKENNLSLKEVLKSKPVIIAVSGPSGAGKDYLTNGAVEHFKNQDIDVINVQMTTERPHRGAVETKICISPEKYTELQENNELIGDHVNKVRYGYQTKQIKEATELAVKEGKMVIIELNPDKQEKFPDELMDNLGVPLTAWIGVSTTPDQTIANMKERGESQESIDQRVEIFNEFIEAMKKNPKIVLCDNGPTNRTNAVSDFIKIIEKSIFEQSQN